MSSGGHKILALFLPYFFCMPGKIHYNKNMRRFYIENISETIKIDGEEHNHISSVLRLKVGDKIACFSNDEFDYVYEIVEIQKKFTICKLNEKKLNNSNLHRPIFSFCLPGFCSNFFIRSPSIL